MQLDLYVEGVEQAQRVFQEIDTNWQTEIESDLDMAGQPLHDALAEYAAPRPGSDYERTYAYRDSIDVHTQIFGETVQLIATQSDVGYWLRGDGDSYEGAWMHRGRWQTLRNIWETYIPVTISRVSARLESWLRLITGD